MTLCAEDTSRKITKRTKAIIPVDIAGMPCDYSELKSVIQSAASDFEPNSIMQEKLGRILLLSDASHSFGASVDGKKSGVLADVTVFSFHAVKNLTTGEGGAVCINLPDSFDVEHSVNFFKAARVHGLTADALSKLKNKSWEYDVVFPSGKSVMSDITAAIALNHLKRYDEVILKRRYELYSQYESQFADYENVIKPLCCLDNAKSSCHLYIIKLKNVSFSEKNQMMRKMYDAGIITNLQFIPIPLLSWYKNNGFTTNGLTVTMKVYDECMSLPLFHDLTNEQISDVCEYLKKYHSFEP
jgi:dTDP-4-amino-4,6-dideoxygalactose transaminase